MNEQPSRATWDHVEAIFDRALALAPAERPAFLDAACGDDPALRTEVEDLLAADRSLEVRRASPARAVQDAGYRLELKIGEGSFGEVWLAEDCTLGHWCAIKLIRPDRRIELKGLQKFRRDVQAHPHVLPLELVRPAGAWLFCVMPLAESANSSAMPFSPKTYRSLTLERALTRLGAFAAADVALIGAGLASALAHLHESGIVHGDIKPGNILRHAGAWKIADYGLVTDIDSPVVLGATCEFLAPEGAGAAVADQYALGITLRKLLDGSAWRPSQSPALEEPVNGRGRRLRAVIDRMIAPNPERRYRSMREVEAALRSFLAPARTRRRRVAAFAALLIALAAGAWYGGSQWSRRAAVAPTGIPRVDLFQVKHIRATADRRPQSQGVINAGSGAVLTSDYVIVEGALSASAYFYVLSLRADGSVDCKVPASDDVAPAAADKFVLPSKENAFLSLAAGPGQQAFALLVSTSPLPPFSEWRKDHPIPWSHDLSPGRWHFDGIALTPLPEGPPMRGGDEVELQTPPALVALVRALGGGGSLDHVDVVSFAVVP